MGFKGSEVQILSPRPKYILILTGYTLSGKIDFCRLVFAGTSLRRRDEAVNLLQVNRFFMHWQRRISQFNTSNIVNPLLPSRNVLKFQSIILALAEIEVGAALNALRIWSSAKTLPVTNIPVIIMRKSLRYTTSSYYDKYFKFGNHLGESWRADTGSLRCPMEGRKKTRAGGKKSDFALNCISQTTTWWHIVKRSNASDRVMGGRAN